MTPGWTTWDGAGPVPDDLVELARSCRRADGGLPIADDPRFLRRRWTGPGGERFGLRSADGALLAAAAICPTPSGVIVTGLIAPEARGRGLGSRLLDHALTLADAAANRAGVGPAVPESIGGAGAAGGGAPVIVETESLTEAAEALFASRGLRQYFAEDVMCIDPAAAPPPRWPAGVGLTGWSGATASRFYTVFEAAFRDRPGFPGTPADEWITETEEDEEFRSDWSMLATVPGLGDAGFVIGLIGWIAQVGVLPEARRRGIGAALICESLSRMAADGAAEAWLDVNVDNPGAAALYRRLGFTHEGRRARYRR
jgi:mycothiol synthase